MYVHCMHEPHTIEIKDPVLYNITDLLGVLDGEEWSGWRDDVHVLVVFRCIDDSL